MDESGRHFLHEFMTGQRPKPKPNKWVNGSLWTLMSLLLGALVYLLINEVIPRRDATPLQPLQNGHLMRPSALHRLGAAVTAVFAALGFVDQARAASKQSPDQCHASEFIRFIGKPVADLEEMQLPDARLVCEHCATTADVRASRLTIIYSEKSNRISRLKCE